MYTTRPGLILGFHGCDQQVGQNAIKGMDSLRPSINKYDWLGHGVYFWDTSLSRALQFAESRANSKRSKHIVRDPAVVGAVLNLGLCFDLLDFENLSYLRFAHKKLKQVCERNNIELPTNTFGGSDGDLLVRELDCAVIEWAHRLRAEKNLLEFDSVRSVFWEGKTLYQNAGFREKNHIQICIRNPNCIKGYFYPLKENESFRKV